MTLNDIARILNLVCETDRQLSGLSIDSRQVKQGELFVAIRGERFDGHDFIRDVAQSGAAAVICEKALPDVTIPQLVVPATLHALAAIATWHRQQHPCPTIAVTGSNGKTSVKEMIAHILPQPAFATLGNLNNHIGAPLSVLQLTAAHRYAVFELGASRAGDIAHTVAVVQPDVALVNNIGPAHIAGFGSLDGVARAKGEIYAGVKPGGTLIINDDDAYAHFWDPLIGDHPCVRFSRLHRATVSADNIVLSDVGHARFDLLSPEGRAAVRLAVPGLHMVSNALAAAACCRALGLTLSDIVRGLEAFKGVAGRMTICTGKQQATIIDDTYNANLSSTLTAVSVLAQRPGLRILVLGDLAELGEWAEPHHHAIGLAAREQGIDGLLTCGELSAAAAAAFGSGATHYADQSGLLVHLLGQLTPNTTVLVKGSRSAAMENIVRELI